MESKNIFDGCFDLMDRGVDRDGIIAYVHDQGVDLSRAVLVINKLYAEKFGEIMDLVANHPSWREEILALEPRPGSIEDIIKGLVR